MSARIETTSPALAVGETRNRQSSAPVTPFRDVLAGGVGVLLGGAEVATHVLGGPVLAAAVHQAGGGVLAGLAGTPPAGGAVLGQAVGTPASGTSALPGGAASDDGNMAAMHAMQRESQAFNLQLLGLQEEIQQENRRFTTLTNVLRAKHDTAKAAVSNIRS